MTYISNTFNTSNDKVKYRLVVDLLEQDLILNRSRIRRRIQAWRTNTGFETYGSGNAYMRNDYGGAVSQVISSSQKITYNSYTELFDDYDDNPEGIWVNHNSDGTRALIVGGYFVINSVVSSIWNDFTVNLPNIPRGSVPTATAANIEEATTININKYNSGYTSTLRFEFPAGDVNALTGTIVEKTALTSYGWVLPSSFYAKIPNSAVGQCKIYCDTFNGDTLIETKSCLFNASVNQLTNKPDVSAVILDTNALSVGLTGDNNKMVRYVSNANVVISALAKNSATLVGIGVTCGDGKSSNVANSTLNAVESGAFNVMAIDSRGLVNSVAYTKDLINYVKLTMNPVLVRNTPVDSKVKLSYSGNYFNGSFGAQANTLTVKYRFREYGEANPWSVFYTLPAPTITGNEYSAEDVILAPGGVEASFNYQKSWEFEILAYDKINVEGIGNIIPVTPGEPNHDYGKGYFNHNSDVEFAKGISVLGQTDLDGVTNALGLISAVAGMNLSAPVEPMRIRYIRDYATGNWHNSSKHWCEIACYTANRAINRAYLRPVTASASITNANYITNGDANTTQYAEINTAGLQYVQIDLGAVFTDITEIVVWHYYLDLRLYYNHKVEVSEDGVNWIKIYDVANRGERTETSTGISIKIPNTKPILISGGGNNKLEYIGYSDGTSDILLNNSPLVQSGTNGLGWWVRYYDGTQICSGCVVTNNSGAGHIIGMPVPFATSTFATMLSARGIASGGATASYVGECYSAGRLHMLGKVLIHYGNSMANPGDTGVSYMAIGRWY